MNKNEPQLNGGLGFLTKMRAWVHRNIKTISTVVGNFCPQLALAISALDSATYDMKITDADLPQSDQNILTPWDTNRFTPFYTDLSHSLQNNVLDKTKDLDTRIQFLNDIYLKIDATKAYYINNENTGLTSDGISNRLGYLDTCFQAIYDVVSQDSTLNILPEVPITKNFKSIDLGFLAIPASASDFSINSSVYQLTKGNPVLPSQATVLITPKLTTEEIKTTIASVTGTTPNITTSNISTVTSPVASNSNNTLLKVVLFVGASAFVLKYAFSNDEEK